MLQAPETLKALNKQGRTELAYWSFECKVQLEGALKDHVLTYSPSSLSLFSVYSINLPSNLPPSLFGSKLYLA